MTDTVLISPKLLIVFHQHCPFSSGQRGIWIREELSNTYKKGEGLSVTVLCAVIKADSILLVSDCSVTFIVFMSAAVQC